MRQGYMTEERMPVSGFPAGPGSQASAAADARAELAEAGQVAGDRGVHPGRTDRVDGPGRATRGTRSPGTGWPGPRWAGTRWAGRHWAGRAGVPQHPIELHELVANIPGAQLKVIPGMGHDFPSQLYDTLADAIAANAKRA